LDRAAGVPLGVGLTDSVPVIDGVLTVDAVPADPQEVPVTAVIVETGVSKAVGVPEGVGVAVSCAQRFEPANNKTNIIRKFFIIAFHPSREALPFCISNTIGSNSAEDTFSSLYLDRAATQSLLLFGPQAPKIGKLCTRLGHPLRGWPRQPVKMFIFYRRSPLVIQGKTPTKTQNSAKRRPS